MNDPWAWNFYRRGHLLNFSGHKSPKNVNLDEQLNKVGINFDRSRGG